MKELEKAKVSTSEAGRSGSLPPQVGSSSTGVSIHPRIENGDVVPLQDPGSLREILDALHKLHVPDDFLSPAERAQAQAPQVKTEL